MPNIIKSNFWNWEITGKRKKNKVKYNNKKNRRKGEIKSFLKGSNDGFVRAGTVHLLSPLAEESWQEARVATQGQGPHPRQLLGAWTHSPSHLIWILSFPFVF